jgi:hypothetical protein
MHFGCYSQVIAVAYSCLLVPTGAQVNTTQLPASTLGYHIRLQVLTGCRSGLQKSQMK